MQGFRQDINGLRAVAVLAVMCFHVGTLPAGGGFLGVDVFFVISGYLMTDIILRRLREGNFSFGAFWSARANRLFPALWVLLAALAGLGWALIDPLTYRQLATQAAASILFLSNIQYWREAGYFDKAAETKWLLHTWSLSVEWQFYLLYPVVLGLAFRFLGARRIVPLLWAALAASLALFLVLTVWRPSVAFFMLPTRAWEMLAGGLIAAHMRRPRLSDRAARALELCGLALILATATLIRPDSPFRIFWAVPPVVGATAIIVAARRDRSVLNLRPLQWIGSRSYSIYLWHWPVIVGFGYAGWGDSFLNTAAQLGLGIGLGALSYRFVEMPWRDRLNRAAPIRTLAWAAPLCAAVLAWSGANLATDGFRDRSPDPHRQQAFAEARSDWDFPEKACTRTGRDLSVNLCRLGSGGDTLVIGDSHANQWLPRAEALKADVTFVTRDGCPPLPRLNVSLGANCPDFYRTALDLARSGRFKRLVFTSFWPSYFRPAKGTSGLCVEFDGACITADRKVDTIRAVFADFTADLKRLDTVERIVLVLPDLEPPGDLPVEFAKRVFFSEATTDLEQADAGATRARGGNVRAALEQVARDVEATTVDPLRTQCGAAECRFVDSEDRLLYRDSNHLRASVARARSNILDPFLSASAE